MRRTLSPVLPSSEGGAGARRGAWVAIALLSFGLVTTGCSTGSAQQIGADAPAAGSEGADGSGGAGAGSVKVGSKPGSTPVRKTLPPGAKDVLSAVAPARVGDVSRVAQAVVPAVKVYKDASGGTPSMTLKNPLPSKAPLVFLIQEERPGWLRVMLPVRPNGSQGWVRASDVKLFQHDYRIVVSIGKRTLTVYRGSGVIMEEKVGLGTSSTPTPGGVFYTKELLKPPKPDGPYGPYAYGLSGYSEVLDEFLGGEGELGIHGTDDPSSIGKSVSHGCIRLRNDAITKLALMLPLGVPVQIVR